MTKSSKKNAAKNQAIEALSRDTHVIETHQAPSFAARFTSFRELLAHLKEESAFLTLPRANRPLPKINDDELTDLRKNQSCH